MSLRDHKAIPPTLARSLAKVAVRTGKFPRMFIPFVVLFVLGVAGVVYGWREWGRNVLARPVYRLAPENVQIPSPPSWIKSDIRAEVIRDGALTDLTVFDKDVTIRVYQAFEMHPWVAKVKRVAKHPPARLDVDLEYRRPVAWVEVPRGVMPGGDGGVIPIDGLAIVLPSHDFTSDDVGNYLRISVPGISACGLAGTPWGDSRIVGAARIAELLADSWKVHKIFRIRIASTPELNRNPTEPIYELETKDRQRIIWGHAPGSDRVDETSIRSKLGRLDQIMKTQTMKSLSDSKAESDIVGDLRGANGKNP